MGLLTQHIRQHCEAAGYPELRRLSRSKLHNILTQAELRPHKIRYYVECRDPHFESKMAAVLHVYKEVEIINQGLLRGELRAAPVITISYDEKPGLQALAPTSPDRPPVPGRYPSHTRDYEYERLGTVSLLAGLDLHTGQVTEIVRDTHKAATSLLSCRSSIPATRRGLRFACCWTIIRPISRGKRKPTCRRCRGVSSLRSLLRTAPGSTWWRPCSARWRGACCGASG